MIKLQNLTPNVYYNQSRDFQFISRLYDLVFNSIKTNADMIHNLPITDDLFEDFAELASLTLGFKSKHNYNVKQLISLCVVFSDVLRKKGTITAIEEVIYAIYNAEGLINKNYLVEFDAKDKYMLNIYISEKLSDYNLLKDVLNYILPAGISCNLVKGEVTRYDDFETKSSSSSSFIYSIPDETVVSVIPKVNEIWPSDDPETIKEDERLNVKSLSNLTIIQVPKTNNSKKGVKKRGK